MMRFRDAFRRPLIFGCSILIFALAHPAISGSASPTPSVALPSVQAAIEAAVEKERTLFGGRTPVPGVLVGGLAGAITMLLLAPKSGKDTRMQMMEKGIELRDRTTEMVEDTMAQVRLNADKMAASGREKMKELKHQGQELAVEQLDRISAVVDAGKTAVKSS